MHLCSSPILNSPEKPFILQIDASNRGVGAVLSQLDASGYDHPVAYFSTKLLPREEQYSTIEKKFLVIKFGVQAFQVYLLGWLFTVQMDQWAMVWMDKLNDRNTRLTRQSLATLPVHS